MQTPQHRHSECKQCEFIGRIGSADMYCCASPSGTCYMLRYSSEGSDYYSTTDFGNRHLQKLRATISGGTDVYYKRMAGIQLCATGITNLMNG